MTNMNNFQNNQNMIYKKQSSLHGFYYDKDIPLAISLRFKSKPPLEANTLPEQNKSRPYQGIFEDEGITQRLFENKQINEDNDKNSKYYKLAVKLKENNIKLIEKIKQWRPDQDSNNFANSERTIFVSNLPYDYDEKLLERNFKIYGKIDRIRIVRDFQGKSRGYGFIEYRNKEGAKEAIKKNSLFIGRREVKIDYEKGLSSKKFIPMKFGGKMPTNRKLNVKVEEKLNSIYEKYPELKLENLENYKNLHSKETQNEPIRQEINEHDLELGEIKEAQ